MTGTEVEQVATPEAPVTPDQIYDLSTEGKRFL